MCLSHTGKRWISVIVSKWSVFQNTVTYYMRYKPATSSTLHVFLCMSCTCVMPAHPTIYRLSVHACVMLNVSFGMHIATVYATIKSQVPLCTKATFVRITYVKLKLLYQHAV